MIPSAGDPAAPRSLCTPVWWPQTWCVQGYAPQSVSVGLCPQHGGVLQASLQDWCLNCLSTACLCVSDLLFPGCAVLGFHLEFKIETGQASLVICECVWMDLVAVIQSAVSQKGQSR